MCIYSQSVDVSHETSEVVLSDTGFALSTEFIRFVNSQIALQSYTNLTLHVYLERYSVTSRADVSYFLQNWTIMALILLIFKLKIYVFQY